MKHATRQNSCKRLKNATAVKWFLLALLCLGLSPAGLPSGGPVAALAQSQEMIEPFEAAGPIDKIVDNTMVIGDRTFRMSDVIRFYTTFTKEEEASFTNFSVGTQVGFTVNQFGEIDEMWLE